MRFDVLTIVLLVACATPCALSAQQAPVAPVCAADAWTLRDVAKIFQGTEEYETGLRASLKIDRVPASEVPRVATSREETDALRDATLGALEHVTSVHGRDAAREALPAYEMDCYRAGSYFLVVLTVSQETQRRQGVILNGWSSGLIFRWTPDRRRESPAAVPRAEDLYYVGVVMM